MDKNFHDLLTRYVNGECTPEEVERVNHWYEEIADKDLRLTEWERGLVEMRMRATIQKAFQSFDKPLARRRFLLSYPLFKVAAAILVIVVSGLWLLSDGESRVEDRRAQISMPADAVLYENEDQASKAFKLPDGSTVQLEAASQIRFSGDFSGNSREVYLTGKAFFDIVRDPARPFYVYTGEVATRVLGTSFFVDAPPNAGKIGVKVITGKVSVFQIPANRSSKNKQSPALKNSTANGVVLSPNQKVEYFIDEEHWVTGLVENPVPIIKPEEQKLSFMFDNTPMKEVLTEINERYGIEVLTENEKIYECTFTGDVSRMSLYDMLDVISNSIGSTYEVKGTRILVSGKGCNSFAVTGN